VLQRIANNATVLLKNNIMTLSGSLNAYEHFNLYHYQQHISTFLENLRREKLLVRLRSRDKAAWQLKWQE